MIREVIQEAKEIHTRAPGGNFTDDDYYDKTGILIDYKF